MHESIAMDRLKCTTVGGTLRKEPVVVSYVAR